MDTQPATGDLPSGEPHPVPDVFTIGRGLVRPVPAELQATLAPATWVIHEWTTFQLSFTGTTHLRIGSRIFPPGYVSPDGLAHFQVRFENELGLATIQPLHAGKPSAGPLHIEVIAKKFPDIHHSLGFMNGLLTDLFARGAALPFDVARRTQRTIRDERRAPNDLFAFHFFRHHHATLIRSVQAILGTPHRVLSDRIEHVRIHEVRKIESESLLHMLRTSTGAGGATLPMNATPLQRLRPERVLQRLPEETYDTPENRFVLSIARRMLGSIRHIRRTSWFPQVQESGIVTDIPATFDRLDHHLRQLVTDHRFAGLEESVSIPSQSRVLQRKDGYRELTQLWDAFHRYQEPVYEEMQLAIDLRDIPTLYEYWLLFELIDAIHTSTSIPPRISGYDGLGQPGAAFRARFAGFGTLTYQPSFGAKHVYSGITLRPDFVFETVEGLRVALDAKFRISHPWPAEDAEVSLDNSRATTDDIAKMHAYRDAIDGVTAALVLYPGSNGFMKSPDGATKIVHGLDDLIEHLIRGDLTGIGAVPMNPIRHLMERGRQLDG